jgi:hypothetical protein
VAAIHAPQQPPTYCSICHSCTLAHSALVPHLPLQFLEGLLTEAYPVVKKAVGGTSSLAGRLTLRLSNRAPTCTFKGLVRTVGPGADTLAAHDAVQYTQCRAALYAGPSTQHGVFVAAMRCLPLPALASPLVLQRREPEGRSGRAFSPCLCCAVTICPSQRCSRTRVGDHHLEAPQGTAHAPAAARHL